MVWVTMTDKFMSGWGEAKNKINKVVFECKDIDEALCVFNNAKERSEMIYVNIAYTKPRYSPKRVYVTTYTRENASRWYKYGGFQITKQPEIIMKS